MKPQSASEFQRANSQRMWFTAGFLVVLVLAGILALSWATALLLKGGPALIGNVRAAAECSQYHLLPLARAIERYRRGTDRYPQRAEDVYPVYLRAESTLRCPLDHRTPRGTSSFAYRRPRDGDRQPVLLVCRNHPEILLVVYHDGPIQPGRTEWRVRYEASPLRRLTR